MNRRIFLRREWPLLSGGTCRIYEYIPAEAVEAEGINAVWSFEWDSSESIDDIILEVEQDVEAHTAWLKYLRDLRDNK
jgi:hypothetical protein